MHPHDRVTSAIIFFALVAGAALVGSRFRPGGWYEHLNKAPWTPANFVFAPVWTLLYVAIAVAGWLVWRTSGVVTIPLCLWLAQLVANALWSWLFFGRHDLGLALLDIATLSVLIAAFMIASAPVSRPATWLFLPYGIWVLYAASLNYYAWVRNGPRGGA